MWILIDYIKEGVKSKDFFGYAASVDDKGNFQGLSIWNYWICLTWMEYL